MADYKKSITFQARLDTSEVGPTIENLKRQFNDVANSVNVIRNQQSTAGRLKQQGFGGMAVPSADEIQKSKRALDSYIRDQAMMQEKVYRLIERQKEKLEKLENIKKNTLRDSKEELAVDERRLAVQEKLVQLNGQYQKGSENINRALDMRARGSIAGTLKQALGIGGGVGGILAATGSAVAAGGALYSNYAQAPSRIISNLGAGVAGGIGSEANIVAGRRSAFEAAFNPERARAAQIAQERVRGLRVESGTGLAGNILGYAGAGATGGAAFGSAFPGVGTAIGSAVGGVGGGLYGAYKAFSDPAQRSLAMSPFSNRYRNEYESIMTKQLGEGYQKALEDIKNTEPGKVLASQYYEQNYMGNLQAQRGMGVGNEQFYGRGGYLQQGINAGFTPEMQMQMSQGILGAGGSSRAAFGNAAFGNQLSRNMNMTNAGQVLGTLSGGLGGAEQTEQATIKIIAEGMRIGLDDSKFAEENRRFTQTTAEIIARTGARTGEDFGRAAEGFGKFVAEPTNAGIGAAKTAYEQYQQISSAVTGPRGNMRAAGFLRDSKLSQLSTMEKQALMQIPEGELTEDHPLVSGLAEKLNISPKNLISRVSSINEGSVSRFQTTDEARDRLRKARVDVGKALTDKAYKASLTADQRADITTLATSRTVEYGNLGTRELTSAISGQVGRAGGGVSDQAARARAGREPGRVEDTTVAETARDAGIMLNNFRQFRSEVAPTAQEVAKLTDRVREFLIVLRNANESEIPGIMKRYIERARNQSQTGKPIR